MQYANVLLALGGDGGNQVPKFFITPAEILVLQAIHGSESVTEVDIIDVDDLPDGDQKEELENRTNAQDLNRLREEYRFARIDDGNGSQLLVMNSLFPGANAKAPASFSDLETLPDEFYKAEERKTPKKAAKKSAKKAEEPAKLEESKTFE